MPGFGIAFQADKPLGDYRELAAIVDRYRFETVSVYQDLFFQPPWPALLELAEHTSNPLVGPAVVNPYLTHPVLIASNLALLDEVSRGRAYLGMGRGAFFQAIHEPQPRPLTAIREAVDVIQHLLRGDAGGYQGEIFRLVPGARLRFPVPGRSLPLLLGGWGERMARLAGKTADMFKVGGCANPGSAAFFRSYLQEGAPEVGREPNATRLVYGAVTVVDRDARVAEAMARWNAAPYVAVAGSLDPTYTPPEEEMRALEQSLASGDEEGAANALSPETLRRFAVFGTPRTLVARFEELFAAGVDRFELGTPHGVDEGEAIRILGEEVLPYFER